MKQRLNSKRRLLGLKGLDFDTLAKMIGLSGRQKWMIRKYIELNGDQIDENRVNDKG